MSLASDFFSGEAAENVRFTSTGGIEATDVQEAIEELDTKKLNVDDNASAAAVNLGTSDDTYITPAALAGSNINGGTEESGHHKAGKMQIIDDSVGSQLTLLSYTDGSEEVVIVNQGTWSQLSIIPPGSILICYLEAESFGTYSGTGIQLSRTAFASGSNLGMTTFGNYVSFNSRTANATFSSLVYIPLGSNNSFSYYIDRHVNSTGYGCTLRYVGYIEP